MRTYVKKQLLVRQTLLALGLTCGAAAIFSGCGVSDSDSSLQQFIGSQVDNEQKIDFKLQKTSLPHSVTRKKIIGGRYAFDSYTHELRFAPMSNADFQKLEQTYSAWSAAKPEIRYEAHKQYALEDFLPPLIKTLLGHKFKEESFSFKAADASILTASTVANCWGTAYELLREAQRPTKQFSVFYAHDDVMQSFLGNPNYSSERKPYSKNPKDFADKATRNEDLQPGDLLIIGGEYLYHVAIFIDDDLYFEKSGSGDTTLFRFVTFDLLQQTWNPELFGWSYRRFDRATLPDAMDLFAATRVFPLEKQLKILPTPLTKHLSALKLSGPEAPRYSYFLRRFYEAKADGKFQELPLFAVGN